MTNPRNPVSEEARDTHRSRQVLRYALGLVVGAGALWIVVSAAGGLGDAIGALRDRKSVV